MAKTEKKDKKIANKESTATGYVCISAHEEPVTHADKSKGFKAIAVGTTGNFDKHPGPCWRPAKEITKIEEVE